MRFQVDEWSCLDVHDHEVWIVTDAKDDKNSYHAAFWNAEDALRYVEWRNSQETAQSVLS